MHLIKPIEELKARLDLDLLKNLAAISFILIGYPLGIFMLISSGWLVNIAGVLITAESLIISAYLLHEFSHWSVFKSSRTNQRWGIVMSWVNGSCYSTFKEIRDKHMHHHMWIELMYLPLMCSI